MQISSLGSLSALALPLLVLSTLGALGACTAQRTAVTFDASRTHGLIFTKTAGCTDLDVVVVVDDKEYRIPEHQERLFVKVGEGLHTIEHYVGSYRMGRWKEQAIVEDAYYALRCFRTPERDVSPNR